jgi:hypothetical protein
LACTCLQSRAELAQRSAAIHTPGWPTGGVGPVPQPHGLSTTTPPFKPPHPRKIPLPPPSSVACLAPSPDHRFKNFLRCRPPKPTEPYPRRPLASRSARPHAGSRPMATGPDLSSSSSSTDAVPPPAARKDRHIVSWSAEVRAYHGVVCEFVCRSQLRNLQIFFANALGYLSPQSCCASGSGVESTEPCSNYYAPSFVSFRFGLTTRVQWFLDYYSPNFHSPLPLHQCVCVCSVPILPKVN